MELELVGAGQALDVVAMEFVEAEDKDVLPFALDFSPGLFPRCRATIMPGAAGTYRFQVRTRPNSSFVPQMPDRMASSSSTWE